MSSEDQRLFAILFKCLWHELGLWGNTEWRKLKREWRRRHGNPDFCFKCQRRLIKNTGEFKNSATLDHIIPMSVLFELELAELMYDHDNFTLLCMRCNTNKGDKMPPIVELPPQLLAKFYWAIDERNKRLALAR